MAKEVPRPFSEPPHTAWGTRWQEWRADRRIAAALFACIAIAAAFAWFRGGAHSSSALPRPTPAGVPGDTFAATTSTTRASSAIVIDIVGAVRRGGVVRLAAGGRVIDAINAAGGATADADLTRLNLAAALTDGARVAVPRLGAPAPGLDPAAVIGAPAPAGDGGPSPGSPVNLNSANAAQLDALPGVGPATAAAIVKDREAHGPFTSVNDLGRVRGIGNSKLDQLRDLVAV